jgi:hypothetical protein
MKKCLVLLVVLLVPVAVVAADVSGKWIAQITSPSGSISERVFTFNVSGNKLTGTLINQSVALATFEVPDKPKMTGKLTTQTGNPLEIAEGEVSGDDISFVVKSFMMGSEVKTVYKGKVSGNEIKFTAETKIPEGMISPSGSPMQPRPPQEFVAKRIVP